MSGSSLISVKVRSITSRNSFGESNCGSHLQERSLPPHEVLVDHRLDLLADLLGDLEHQGPVVDRLGAEDDRSTGSPNSIRQRDGSGIAPRGPSHGNVGVIGM